MSTIEGGMLCTDDTELYQTLRILRGHGLLREANDKSLHQKYIQKFEDLNKDFIFLHKRVQF